MKVKNKKEVIESLEDCIIHLNERTGKKEKPKKKKEKQKLQKAS